MVGANRFDGRAKRVVLNRRTGSRWHTTDLEADRRDRTIADRNIFDVKVITGTNQTGVAFLPLLMDAGVDDMNALRQCRAERSHVQPREPASPA